MDNTPDILTGIASLEFLDGLGAQFCLTDGKFGRKPCDDTGRPIDGNYQDMPQPFNVAAAHLRQRGGVGVLTHLSAGLTLLDVDYGLESFLTMYPKLDAAPRVFRTNAPDRAKLVILVSDHAGKITRQDAETPTRKAELLGRGHGNVAGNHPSGEPYKLLTGIVMVFTRAEIEKMLNQWIPQAWSSYNERPASVLRPPQPLSSGDQIRQAIGWWIQEPANNAEVDRLLAGCKHAGKYIALRADDRTPSSTRSDVRDGFYKRTWRDHGSGQTLDAYELYIQLTGTDKATHKWQVVNDWRVSEGRQPLRLR